MTDAPFVGFDVCPFTIADGQLKTDRSARPRLDGLWQESEAGAGEQRRRDESDFS